MFPEVYFARTYFDAGYWPGAVADSTGYQLCGTMSIEALLTGSSSIALSLTGTASIVGGLTGDATLGEC